MKEKQDNVDYKNKIKTASSNAFDKLLVNDAFFNLLAVVHREDRTYSTIFEIINNNNKQAVEEILEITGIVEF